MEKIKVLLVAASLRIGGAEKVAADVGLYVHQNMMKLKIISQHCS